MTATRALSRPAPQNPRLTVPDVDIRICLGTGGVAAGSREVLKAFEDGCVKVVLILTKPEGTVRADGTDRKLARVIRRRYPKAAEQLALRAQHYNEGIALAEQLAAEGKVLIIAPDDTCGVKTLTRDQEALKKLYSKGIRDAQAIEAFIK